MICPERSFVLLSQEWDWAFPLFYSQFRNHEGEGFLERSSWLIDSVGRSKGQHARSVMKLSLQSESSQFISQSRESLSLKPPNKYYYSSTFIEFLCFRYLVKSCRGIISFNLPRNAVKYFMRKMSVTFFKS